MFLFCFFSTSRSRISKIRKINPTSFPFRCSNWQGETFTKRKVQWPMIAIEGNEEKSCPRITTKIWIHTCLIKWVVIRCSTILSDETKWVKCLLLQCRRISNTTRWQSFSCDVLHCRACGLNPRQKLRISRSSHFSRLYLLLTPDSTRLIRHFYSSIEIKHFTGQMPSPRTTYCTNDKMWMYVRYSLKILVKNT